MRRFGLNGLNPPAVLPARATNSR